MDCVQYEQEIYDQSRGHDKYKDVVMEDLSNIRAYRSIVLKPPAARLHSEITLNFDSLTTCAARERMRQDSTKIGTKESTLIL